ncbi:MAG: septum formation initiator family protein [Candidatus Edwardsbacteria bacterium]|nr:septum formation initiator family protein [Candidatus Edwardsbacteria bacterium]
MPPRPRRRPRPYRTIAVVAGGAVLALALVLGTTRYGWITMVRFDRRERALDRALLVELARIEILRQERARLLRDRRYLEAKAREELGMVRPGEVSYRFYRADSLRKKRP